VPSGKYKELRYTLGVDSTRNVSGVQDGALSVSNGMFWSWNTGYIMLKAEGLSPNSATGQFTFHLVGYKGSHSIVTQKSTDLGGAKLMISSNATPQVHLIANVAHLWHSSNSVSVDNTIHMPGTKAKTMATDFYQGILFDHIHN
jgi:hypothetical protein